MDPEVKCYLPGVPRANYMPYPFQIFQSASQFFIAYEYAGAVRNIYLKDPGPPPVDSWMGQSVGHWEGETFVVDAKGFNDGSWFDRAGNFHSDQLHVIERWTRTAPDIISYEATIEDPQTFTRPWKIQFPALSPRRRSSDHGLQVRRVRRRAALRPVSEEPASAAVKRHNQGVFIMRNRLLTFAGAVTVAVAVTAPIAGQAPAGQRPRATPENYTPKRLADGHPDLQGLYDIATLTPLERGVSVAMSYSPCRSGWPSASRFGV